MHGMRCINVEHARRYALAAFIPLMVVAVVIRAMLV